MSLFNNTEFKLPIFFQFRKGWFRSGSLMTRLLAGIIPPVVIILIGAGYIILYYLSDFLPFYRCCLQTFRLWCLHMRLKAFLNDAGRT